MTLEMQRSFSAQPAAIGAALDFVEACCSTAGVARDDMLRLVLVTEELLTNTVMHGHQGGADAPVQIALAIEPDGMRLDYRDAAPPFDPLAAPAAWPADDRPGGLGLVLVQELASELRYTREPDGNRLQLRLPRRG